MLRRILPWLLFLIALIAGIILRDEYAGNWLDASTNAQGQTEISIYQVEADAYARLARVQRILQGHGLVQRFHPQENYPEGMKPTTTLPFDLIILALYLPAKVFSTIPLDWAGALVSPILYLVLALFLFFWSRAWPLRARFLLLLGLACFPALVWATPFARPDHQSLNLALIGAAICLEWRRWKPGLPARNPFAIAAGILWGLALWNSFFEPLIFFVIIIIFNLAVRRREQSLFLITAATTLLLSLLAEGFHWQRPPVEFDDYLVRWLSTVGEIKPLTLETATISLTPVFWLLPFFLFRLLWSREREITDWLLLVLSVALGVLVFFQSRWAYFTSFTLLLAMAFWYSRESIVWLRRVLLGVIVFSVMWSLDRDLDLISRREEPPTAQLRRMAATIQTPGGILAPWWLSSPLLYYSGQPIVAGSSHMTIPGIVDSARYFTATSWLEGDAILQKHKVRWVLVYDPERTVPNSRKILGLTPPKTSRNPEDVQLPVEVTLTERLYNLAAIPTRYHLRAVEQDCKLYEYIP